MIVEEHRNFARAVVELARSHNMDNLDMTFRNGSLRFDGKRLGWERIRLVWSTGRHGDKAPIKLSTEAGENIDEANYTQCEVCRQAPCIGGDHEFVPVTKR